MDKLNLLSVPVIVVINKIDKLIGDESASGKKDAKGRLESQSIESLVEKWHGLVPKADILPMSALEKFNTDILLNKIVSLLPQQPAWYDRDVFTDKNLRFFASEILREKILENYTKEIPYCTEVVIEQFKEEEEMYSIEAVINVVRESQKGIIIGKKGAALKRVGTQARKEMENFFEKKVFLKIFVKVDPSWRENKKELKRFGYIQ